MQPELTACSRTWAHFSCASGALGHLACAKEGSLRAITNVLPSKSAF